MIIYGMYNRRASIELSETGLSFYIGQRRGRKLKFILVITANLVYIKYSTRETKAILLLTAAASRGKST